MPVSASFHGIMVKMRSLLVASVLLHVSLAVQAVVEVSIGYSSARGSSGMTQRLTQRFMIDEADPGESIDAVLRARSLRSTWDWHRSSDRPLTYRIVYTGGVLDEWAANIAKASLVNAFRHDSGGAASRHRRDLSTTSVAAGFLSVVPDASSAASAAASALRPVILNIPAKVEVCVTFHSSQGRSRSGGMDKSSFMINHPLPSAYIASVLRDSGLEATFRFETEFDMPLKYRIVNRAPFPSQQEAYAARTNVINAFAHGGNAASHRRDLGVTPAAAGVLLMKMQYLDSGGRRAVSSDGVFFEADDPGAYIGRIVRLAGLSNKYAVEHVKTDPVTYSITNLQPFEDSAKADYMMRYLKKLFQYTPDHREGESSHLPRTPDLNRVVSPQAIRGLVMINIQYAGTRRGTHKLVQDTLWVEADDPAEYVGRMVRLSSLANKLTVETVSSSPPTFSVTNLTVLDTRDEAKSMKDYVKGIFRHNPGTRG